MYFTPLGTQVCFFLLLDSFDFFVILLAFCLFLTLNNVERDRKQGEREGYDMVSWNQPMDIACDMHLYIKLWGWGHLLIIFCLIWPF